MSLSFRSETRELNDTTRRMTGGSFVPLADGVTHYELGNPTKDNTVVLVHGFSVPYFIFDPTFHFLKEHGFRVLRYDLFGRGFSDRPDVHYNIDFFVQQLTDLLDALRLTRPVSLIGLSMGGPITAAYTALHPERVDKLVLVDPAGARPILLSRILKAAARPFVGEAILGLVGSGGMVKHLAFDLFDQRLVGHFQDRYLLQMQFKGFRRAILSTIRNGMLDSFIETYRKVGAANKPVMLIWGRHDTTIPLRHSDDLRASIPNIEFHIIEDCSHIPHFEKPAETNALLLDFLRK
ncbi:MAG: alpha/beta hydrolase [Chloroflexota bacterium]